MYDMPLSNPIDRTISLEAESFCEIVSIIIKCDAGTIDLSLPKKPTKNKFDAVECLHICS